MSKSTVNEISTNMSELYSFGNCNLRLAICERGCQKSVKAFFDLLINWLYGIYNKEYCIFYYYL